MTATERLRAQHREVVHQVKVALKPGDPRRLGLLASCDDAARKIRAIRASEDRQMTPCTVRRPEPSEFQRLISAINTGTENEIVDEATRIVRARIKSRHPAQKAKLK